MNHADLTVVLFLICFFVMVEIVVVEIVVVLKCTTCFVVVFLCCRLKSHIFGKFHSRSGEQVGVGVDGNVKVGVSLGLCALVCTAVNLTNQFLVLICRSPSNNWNMQLKNRLPLPQQHAMPWGIDYVWVERQGCS